MLSYHPLFTKFCRQDFCIHKQYDKHNKHFIVKFNTIVSILRLLRWPYNLLLFRLLWHLRGDLWNSQLHAQQSSYLETNKAVCRISSACCQEEFSIPIVLHAMSHLLTLWCSFLGHRGGLNSFTLQLLSLLNHNKLIIWKIYLYS